MRLNILLLVWILNPAQVFGMSNLSPNLGDSTLGFSTTAECILTTTVINPFSRIGIVLLKQETKKVYVLTIQRY